MTDKETPSLKYNPFRPGSELVKSVNPLKRELAQKVSELQVGKEVIALANSKVRELSVRDLNDLASEFAGVPTKNAAISDLSFDDLRNIEEVFTDFKLQVAERVALDGRVDLAAVDVSCCCCTPCCCCAAAVVEPATV